MFLGYYAMVKVDKFIENNVEHSNGDLCDKYKDCRGMEEKLILIYGNNEITNLVKDYCDLQKYKYESIIDINSINSEVEYRCLFTLSYHDTDNLMVSSVGFKVYSIPSVIALCNNQNYLKIYKEFNFAKTLLYTYETDKLFNAIKELVEDAVKDKIKI